MEANLDKRYQTLLVLWIAMLMNVVIFFVLIRLAAPESAGRPDTEPFSLVTFVLAAVGAFLVVISFTVKNKMLERSVDRQNIDLVQKAYVLAWAICEVSALIGFVERFVLGNSDYFLMLIIAFIGIALHFPKRDHLKSASYKSPEFGSAEL
jgi:hypothetical protein